QLLSPTTRPPLSSTLFPYTTLFRSTPLLKQHKLEEAINLTSDKKYRHSHLARVLRAGLTEFQYETSQSLPEDFDLVASAQRAIEDRKSTRLNSSHDQISYAVFCLKK